MLGVAPGIEPGYYTKRAELALKCTDGEEKKREVFLKVPPGIEPGRCTKGKEGAPYKKTALMDSTACRRPSSSCICRFLRFISSFSRFSRMRPSASASARSLWTPFSNSACTAETPLRPQTLRLAPPPAKPSKHTRLRSA